MNGINLPGRICQRSVLKLQRNLKRLPEFAIFGTRWLLQLGVAAAGPGCWCCCPVLLAAAVQCCWLRWWLLLGDALVVAARSSWSCLLRPLRCWPERRRERRRGEGREMEASGCLLEVAIFAGDGWE